MGRSRRFYQPVNPLEEQNPEKKLHSSLLFHSFLEFQLDIQIIIIGSIPGQSCDRTRCNSDISRTDPPLAILPKNLHKLPYPPELLETASLSSITRFHRSPQGPGQLNSGIVAGIMLISLPSHRFRGNSFCSVLTLKIEGTPDLPGLTHASLKTIC